MRTIHELGYCHKDLSLSNIFLDENYEPKIGDFGEAVKNRDDLNKFIGTRRFKPPEVIEKLPHDGQKVDIFSLGQILIYIVFGKPGFDNPDNDDGMYYLINENEEKKTKKEKEECLKKYWEKMGICNGFEKEIISDEFKDLYMKMVSPEPDKRLTIKKILEHPWLQSAGDIDEKLRKEFRRRIPKIEDEIKKEINEMKDDNLTLFGNKPNTKATKDGDKIKFNSDKKPKNLPDYYNDRFSIIFKEYSKDNANKIMNNLYVKINNKYENNCEIHCDKDKFKMDITFEDEQGETIEMKIKLYQFKDGLILKFFKKSKDKTEFFEKFKEIVGLLTENK